MEKKEAIEIIKNHLPNSSYKLNEALETLIPELKEPESEDERVRKELMGFVVSNTLSKDDRRKKYLTWLDKQKETFTKKDVEDAYLKGVCDAKQELEKQDESIEINRDESCFRISVSLGDSPTSILKM